MGYGKSSVYNAPTKIEGVTNFNCHSKSSNPENPFLNVPQIANFTDWLKKQ